MSAIEASRQKMINAQKAAELDRIQRDQENARIFTEGRNAALSEVEMRLMQKRAEQEAMDRQMQAARAQFDTRGANDYNPSLGEFAGRVGNYLKDTYNNASNKVSAFLDSAAENVGRSEYPGPNDKGGM